MIDEKEIVPNTSNSISFLVLNSSQQKVQKFVEVMNTKPAISILIMHFDIVVLKIPKLLDGIMASC